MGERLQPELFNQASLSFNLLKDRHVSYRLRSRRPTVPFSFRVAVAIVILAFFAVIVFFFVFFFLGLFSNQDIGGFEVIPSMEGRMFCTQSPHISNVTPRTVSNPKCNRPIRALMALRGGYVFSLCDVCRP